MPRPSSHRRPRAARRGGTASRAGRRRRRGRPRRRERVPGDGVGHRVPGVGAVHPGARRLDDGEGPLLARRRRRPTACAVTGHGAVATNARARGVGEGAGADDDVAHAEVNARARRWRRAPRRPSRGRARASSAHAIVPESAPKLGGERGDVGVVRHEAAVGVADERVGGAATRALASSASTSARMRSLCGTVTLRPSSVPSRSARDDAPAARRPWRESPRTCAAGRARGTPPCASRGSSSGRPDRR